MPGIFVISLDFELHWGVRDHVPIERYRRILLGERLAVVALLKLFRDHEIHATWATVGFLFARDRQELEACLPSRRPTYVRRELNPYEGFWEHVGRNEEEDPFHYAASLVSLISSTPYQEVGSHTFSHYYCLEPGQKEADFADDLASAQAIAALRGLTLRSLVFPRNQVNKAYLSACRRAGFLAFRGEANSWLYEPRAGAGDSIARRGARLLDAYLPLSGDNSWPSTAAVTDIVDVRASRFLRPFNNPLRWLEPLRVARILEDLESAARQGRCYHLWWHPHNFGANLEENLSILARILDRVGELRTRHGLRSLNMGEVADEARRASDRGERSPVGHAV